ncbi:Hypothetical protein, putative [Bodo saltans]|uniref:Uncharacterized protein n=1 Tax=Bodo saltans TaxID=75058 RepID=A0A0S4JHA0_BODSA|nr:Hypothetical protein, putative [Bodo saltans]|eukprot:CUG90920.1 Hypothetical protein, putative [Bodo saltans]
MWPGSLLGNNTLPQQPPRGRATQRPTMSPALMRGMRSSTQPEWWCLEHCSTQILPQSPHYCGHGVSLMNSCNQALGWCRVASVTSPPALSLRKDTSPPALPDMTSGERAVVDQIKQCAIMDDLVKVSINLPRAQTEALGKDIKTFMRRIAENGTPKRLTTVELGSSLSIGEYRVAFCSVADGNLIIGVATLGVDPTPPTGTKKVDTVKIKIDDESSVPHLLRR